MNDKLYIPDITIVTAFFDIGRGSLPDEKHGRKLPWYQHRSVDTYFEYFDNLARLNNDMVIYTTPDLVDRVRLCRMKHDRLHRTTIVSVDEYCPPNMKFYKDHIQNVMNDPKFYNNVINPQLIEYWHVDYVLVNIFKSLYVTSALVKGHIKNPLVSWIDFGYARNLETIPKHVIDNGWRFKFHPSKIHLFNQRDIFDNRDIKDIIYTGDVYIQGCHIVGGQKAWIDFGNIIRNQLDILLSKRLIDDDQTLLLMAALENPELIELHTNSPDDWFRIFRSWAAK